MVMVVTTAVPADSLRQILYVGQLAARRGIRKVAGELGKLVRGVRIPIRLGGLSGAGKICRDLLSNLLILAWIRFLQLLERTQHLAEGRKLAAVRLLGRGRPADAAQTAGGGAGSQTHFLQGAAENRFHAVGKNAEGTGTHVLLIGIFHAS